MVRRCRVLSVAVCLLLSWLWRGSEGVVTYTPVYGTSSQTSYDATTGSKRFPDIPVILDQNSQYFINELNFNAISGKLLVGAADRLYQLSTDLSEEVQYPWETNSNSLQICQASAENSTFTCRNHIRVYKKIPANPDLLLICGTQAAEVPQCRTLNITGGDVDAGTQSAVKNATNGMISYYPFFNGFGDFRNDEPMDTTYLTAGFFDGSSGIGRHFSISYQNITFTDPANPDTLTLTERFSTIRDNSYWLRNPVTFVDFVKMDYTAPLPGTNDAQNADDYQLYFLFLRERLNVKFNTFDILSSRVVRICRNDPGSSAGGDQEYFLTYMKARIYCNQRVPGGRENEGAIDYLYDELMSVGFNNMGRYVQNSPWNKTMYGAFSSSAVGPRASAVCIYNAANSQDPAVGGDGMEMGVFDIFRENIIEATDNMAMPDNEIPNFLFECTTDMQRTNDEARNQVIIANDVLQAVPDPLLVLPDVYITKLVLDQVCVVTKDNPTVCVNQDILFLATDMGKVLKVVFGLDSNNESFPIIAEEIELDDDNEVSQMEIEEVGGVKYIFVSTSTKVYRFPLHRCSRHATCIDCIASRDPYCVWNTNNSQCEATMLSAVTEDNGAVDSGMYRQNIHTGMDPDTCRLSPVCDLAVSALNDEMIQVEIQCNGTSDVTICIPTLGVNNAMTLGADGTATNTYPGSRGLQTHEVILKTDAGTGPNSGPTFSDSVTTPAGAPVALDATQIYADDVTATSFRVTVIPDIFTDDFENYEFQVSYTAASQAPTVSVTGFQALTVSHSIVITGLPDSDEVTYSVELRNSQGSVMMSSLSIDLRDSTPGAVQNLMVTDITADSVTLDWDEPTQTNGDIDGYSISWNGGRDLSVTGTMTTISGLTPSVAYSFDVQACNDAGCGATESVSATTECAAAEQVTAFLFDSITASSLSYTWAPPAVANGDPAAVTYNVRSTCYLPIDGETNAMLDSSTDTSGTITGLEPLTYCCVTVTAVNNCDIDGSPASVLGLEYVQCEQTNDIAPGVVRNLTVTALSPTSLLAVWNPPENYERPGVAYTVSYTSSGNNIPTTSSVLDQTSYFIDNLMSNTEYSVAVVAASGVGSGSAASVDQTTAPSAPNPPTNPVLTFPDPSDLTRLNVTWEDATSAAFSVMSYTAVVRCNEFEASMNVLGDAMTAEFTVDDPGTDFSWCTGQVQAVNSIGRSEFSELANVVIPSRVPGLPRCFLTDDLGSAVNISFTVTHPFSLSDLTVMYSIESDIQPLTTESYQFNAENGTNGVIVLVTRNTLYDFQLWLCNTAGCGPPCQELRNFTTSTISPRPPTVIEPMEITASTVNVTWEAPMLENEDTIEYTVQVSGTTTEPVVVEGLTQRWNMFEGLSPERQYTAAIQVRDTESNITGVFGPAGEFTMLSGIPTEPRFVTASFENTNLIQQLIVVYSVPQNTNGTLTLYEIRWASSSRADCDNIPLEIMRSANQTNLAMNEYRTTDVGNINTSTVLLVCVRAYTQEAGLWGHFIDLNFTTGEFGQNPDGTDDCNGLIAVAVIAGVAIASSIVMTILLAFVVNRRWRPFDKWCGQGYDDYQDRPKLNTLQSIGSTASTAGLITKIDGENGDLTRNGSRESTYDHEPRSHI